MNTIMYVYSIFNSQWQVIIKEHLYIEAKIMYNITLNPLPPEFFFFFRRFSGHSLR